MRILYENDDTDDSPTDTVDDETLHAVAYMYGGDDPGDGPEDTNRVVDPVLRARAAKLDSDDMAGVYIANVVATCRTGTEFNLSILPQETGGAVMNIRDISAAKMRLVDPLSEVVTTVLIFANGKLVVVGAPSETCALSATIFYISHMRSLGYETIAMHDFCIQNIVSAFHKPYGLHLARLKTHDEYAANIKFSPGLFPGAIIQMDCIAPGVTFLVFASGAGIIAGAKNRAVQKLAFWWISRLLDRNPEYHIWKTGPSSAEAEAETSQEYNETEAPSDSPRDRNRNRTRTRTRTRTRNVSEIVFSSDNVDLSQTRARARAPGSLSSIAAAPLDAATRALEEHSRTLAVAAAAARGTADGDAPSAVILPGGGVLAAAQNGARPVSLFTDRTPQTGAPVFGRGRDARPQAHAQTQPKTSLLDEIIVRG